jgi:signal transduction histidine kinase
MPAHLNHISDMARELTRAMDETVWAVNPHNDSLEGLMTYVTKFAQDYLNVAGIRCRIDMPAQLPPHHLSAEARHNLYLAVKETLNNVVKHAQATEVWLRLTVSAEGFMLVIEDNGRGIMTAGKNGTPSGRISTGHGLHNLEKRLAASSGRCIVTSETGKGTRVEFNVNLNGSN